MPLTKIDCFYWNHQASIDQGTAAFVMLNPTTKPGVVVAAGAAAHRDSIGGQVACKLALDHFVEDVLDNFAAAAATSVADDQRKKEKELSMVALESAFKKANTSVYSFGHKLAAAGRMSASLLGMVVSDNNVATARAGIGSAFLLRRGELFPFFAERQEIVVAAQEGEQLVGAHSLISVEVASVGVEAEDLILLLGNIPDASQARRLPVIMKGVEKGDLSPLHTIIRRVFENATPPPFAMLVRVGPDSIYLR